MKTENNKLFKFLSRTKKLTDTPKSTPLPKPTQTAGSVQRLVRLLFSFRKFAKILPKFRSPRGIVDIVIVKSRNLGGRRFTAYLCSIFILLDCVPKSFALEPSKITGENIEIGIGDRIVANENGVENISGAIELLSLVSPEVQAETDDSPEKKSNESDAKTDDGRSNVVVYILLQIAMFGFVLGLFELGNWIYTKIYISRRLRCTIDLMKKKTTEMQEEFSKANEKAHGHAAHDGSTAREPDGGFRAASCSVSINP